MVAKWNKAILRGIADLAIILAGIQLAPIILSASTNKFLAFIIPSIMLIAAIFLLRIVENS